MKYPPAIEVYHEACDEIRGWMTDWLHQSEFDRLSREHRPMQRRVVGYTGETVILGLSFGDVNLELLQEMIRHKIVKARKAKQGGVEYRAVPE